MDLQPETYERALAGLQEGCCEGRLKNRTDSILLFAELSDAGIDQEEFCSVRNHLNRVLRHSRAIRRALRRGDEQIGKIKEALGPKPPTPLEESAIKSFQVLGCRDFGRIDYRLGREGTPYFLEINPLPGLGDYSDLVIMALKLGWKYDALIGAVLNAALERYPQCK